MRGAPFGPAELGRESLTRWAMTSHLNYNVGAGVSIPSPRVPRWEGCSAVNLAFHLAFSATGLNVPAIGGPVCGGPVVDPTVGDNIPCTGASVLRLGNIGFSVGESVRDRVCQLPEPM